MNENMFMLLQNNLSELMCIQLIVYVKQVKHKKHDLLVLEE